MISTTIFVDNVRPLKSDFLVLDITKKFRDTISVHMAA